MENQVSAVSAISFSPFQLESIFSFYMVGSNNFQPIFTRTEVISSALVHQWTKSGTSTAPESLVSNEPELNSSACQIIASHYSVILTQRNVTHHFVKVPWHPITRMCQFHLCAFPVSPLIACKFIAGPFSYIFIPQRSWIQFYSSCPGVLEGSCW